MRKGDRISVESEMMTLQVDLQQAIKDPKANFFTNIPPLPRNFYKSLKPWEQANKLVTLWTYMNCIVWKLHEYADQQLLEVTDGQWRNLVTALFTAALHDGDKNIELLVPALKEYCFENFLSTRWIQKDHFFVTDDDMKYPAGGDSPTPLDPDRAWDFNNVSYAEDGDTARNVYDLGLQHLAGLHRDDFAHLDLTASRLEQLMQTVMENWTTKAG